jgi:hypothetical protein
MDLRAAIRKNILVARDARSAKVETMDAPPPIQASQLDDWAKTKAKTAIAKR